MVALHHNWTVIVCKSNHPKHEIDITGLGRWIIRGWSDLVWSTALCNWAPDKVRNDTRGVLPLVSFIIQNMLDTSWRTA